MALVDGADTASIALSPRQGLDLQIPTQAAHLFRSDAAQGSDLMAPMVLISSRPPF
jgi:hypothetical protein